MKKPFWEMPAPEQTEIMRSLEDMFRDMFTWMNVGSTTELVRQHDQRDEDRAAARRSFFKRRLPTKRASRHAPWTGISKAVKAKPR